MKRLIQLNLLLLLISSATAQDSQPQGTSPQQRTKILRVYDWKDLAGQIPNSQIVSMDGVSVLKIENTNDTPLEVSLLTITNSIIKKASVLSLEMKYENVHSKYSQIIDRFSDGRRFIGNHIGGLPNDAISSLKFLTQFAPDALGGDEITNDSKIDIYGTMNWQPFRFACRKSDDLPEKLELNLNLVISGTVYLRPIKLLEITKNSNWWTPEQAGKIGGIGGSVIGCFGALLGLLASKGKARTFVLTTMKIFIALGILLTIAGFAAVVSSQPYAVWYALLLPGVILTLVFSLTLPSIQRRYDELEIRRMTSVDTMGS